MLFLGHGVKERHNLVMAFLDSSISEAAALVDKVEHRVRWSWQSRHCFGRVVTTALGFGGVIGAEFCAPDLDEGAIWARARWPIAPAFPRAREVHQ